MRFEDRLRPHFQIDPATIGARLPSLLLQPLVENAIKYAVTPQEEGADIWIDGAARGRPRCVIDVADTGPGADARHRMRGAASRPESAWRTFATVWRRPMAPTIASRHRSNDTGGLQRYHRNSLSKPKTEEPK